MRAAWQAMGDNYRKLSILFFLAAFLAAGCGQGNAAPTETSEVNPAIPAALERITRTPSEFDIVSSDLCPVAEWETIHVSGLQGDLIAWAPGQAVLAYLAPKSDYSWFTGNLALASGKDFKSQETITGQIEISGGLSWAPDGRHIAFIAMRPSEQIYTVMAAASDGTDLVDLFPEDSARTDEWSSPKAIVDWADNEILDVVVSCGAGCDQPMQVDVSTGGRTPTGEPGHGDIKNDYWQPTRNIIDFEAGRFPDMIAPNWSPDKKNVSYFDEEGNLWVLRRGEKVRFPIDTGSSQAEEAKWSSDSRYLAVRTDRKILILSASCS